MDKKAKKWVVDLSNPMLKAYINYGHGLEEDGVVRTERGIECYAKFESGLYPMYALEFKDYLEQQEIAVEDVQEIHLVVAAYDEQGEEIDFSIEYEKCALVSEDELNGYSNSDILPTTNYKVIGSKEITKIKLTDYNGYKADGVSLSGHELHDAVGINIQFTNGEINRIRKFILLNMELLLPADERTEHLQENYARQETVAEPKVLIADLEDKDIVGYMNLGKGIVEGGVNKLDGLMLFENEYDEEVNCMLAIDFSRYLYKKGIRIQDVTSFEIQFGVYDASGTELDFEEDYQKCAFVSAEALNGYSDSDILAEGNYKLIGSNVHTVFDLTVYDGSMPHKIEEGVGFNIQVLNGDRSQTKYVSLNNLKFNYK